MDAGGDAIYGSNPETGGTDATSFEFQDFQEALRQIQSSMESGDQGQVSKGLVCAEEDGPSESGGNAANYFTAKDLPKIIEGIQQRQDMQMLSFALKSLRRIVSAGHDQTILLILNTYGGVLGSILPELLARSDQLEDQSFTTKSELKEDILWILTNLSAVLNIGTTNQCQRQSYEFIKGNLSKNILNVTVSKMVNDGSQTLTLSLSLLANLLDPCLFNPFTKNFLEQNQQAYKQKIEALFQYSNGTICEETLDKLVQISSVLIESKLLEEQDFQWHLFVIMLVIMKTKDQSVLHTSITVFKECLEESKLELSTQAVSQCPQKNEFLQTLLVFTTKSGNQVIEKLSETCLIIIGELMATKIAEPLDSVILIELNLVSYLSFILKDNPKQSQNQKLNLVLWLMQNSIADNKQCLSYVLTELKKPESEVTQFISYVLQIVHINVTQNQLNIQGALTQSIESLEFIERLLIYAIQIQDPLVELYAMPKDHLIRKNLQLISQILNLNRSFHGEIAGKATLISIKVIQKLHQLNEAGIKNLLALEYKQQIQSIFGWLESNVCNTSSLPTEIAQLITSIMMCYYPDTFNAQQAYLLQNLKEQKMEEILELEIIS